MRQIVTVVIRTHRRPFPLVPEGQPVDGLIPKVLFSFHVRDTASKAFVCMISHKSVHELNRQQ